MAGNRVALILAVICATGASVLVYQTMKRSSKAKVVEIPKVPVVIAKDNIPARMIIQTDQLEVKLVPKDTVNPEAATKITELQGLITKSELLKGEPINLNRIVKKGERLGLSFIIPEGKRAITVAVNEVNGVGGFIKPGDIVDVLGVLEPKNSTNGSYSWTVVQQLAVLAVAQDMGASDPEKNKADGKTASKKNDPNSEQTEGKISTSVTLAVTPEEAQLVTLASEKGALRLTMHPIIPQLVSKLNPVNETTLIPKMPTKIIHTERKIASPIETKVEVISGNKAQYINVY